MNSNPASWVRPYQTVDFALAALRQGLARSDLSPGLRREGEIALARLSPLRQAVPGEPLDLFARDEWSPSPEESRRLGDLLSALRHGTLLGPLEPSGHDPSFSLLRGIWHSPRSVLGLHDDLALHREGTASHGTTPSLDTIREETLRKAEGSEPARVWAREIFESSFGVYFLINQGLNWQFTDLLYDRDYKRSLSEDPSLSPADLFFFFQNPTGLATQQRFEIFKKVTQAKLADGAVFASLPCGRMRDFAVLDFSGCRGVTLVGIDLDPEALAGASLFTYGLAAHPAIRSIEFFRRDAMFLGAVQAFDLLSSNGLTMYVGDEERFAMFRSSFESLRRGGTFVTSHLNPPAEWRQEAINRDHGTKGRHLGKIVHPRWIKDVRSETFIVGQLRDAGFGRIEVLPDDANMFPTFVAAR